MGRSGRKHVKHPDRRFPELALHKRIKQAKSWQGALHTLRSSGGGVVPLTAALSRCSGRHWRHAVSVLSDFANLALEPSTITYNAATSACERGRQWQQALHLQRRLTVSGAAADTISLNSLVSASEAMSRWQSAAAHVESMGRAAVVLATWLAVCNDLFLNIDSGFPWLSQVTQDSITFNSAITAFEKGTQWFAALFHLEGMAWHSCSPNACA